MSSFFKNVGQTGANTAGVAKNQTGEVIQFKRLVGGSNVVVTENDTSIILSLPNTLTVGGSGGGTGNDYWIDNGSALVATSSVIITGSLTATNLSGSHTTLEDGSPAFLGDGASITVNFNPNGAVEITSSAGGAHAANHIDGGSDVIDGDKLQVSWTGHSNYTPSTSPSETDETDQLTAHLAGIDTAIGTAGGTGPVDSVFGRTSAVVAAASDYNASQVDNDSSVPGSFVDDALNHLDATKAESSTALTASVLVNDAGVPGDYIDDALDHLDATKAESSTALTASVLVNDSNNPGAYIDDALNNPIIGDAEDADYTDGLFVDFTTTTTVGTAVDRFNEVLKSLSPASAPGLDNLGVADTGVGGKLSFGSGNAIAGYTNVGATGSFGSKDINDDYIVETSSGDLRRGILGATTTVNGILNDDVSADSPNYPDNAFGDGDAGDVIMDLNGTDLITVDLTSATTAITQSTGNGSHIRVSPLADGAFPNGDSFTIFKHRTGEWSIDPADQRDGWNYVKITHLRGGTSYPTNFVEWVNDSDTTQITATGMSLANLSMQPALATLSGIKYHTAGTCGYTGSLNNIYRNTYSRSATAISFGGSTNLSIASRAIPDMAAETDVEPILEDATLTGTKLLDATVTARVTVDHPITGDELSSGGASSIAGVLMYTLSASAAATVLTEDFRGEEYRLESGAYANQSDVTTVANYFNVATDRSAGTDLFTYDETMVAKPSLDNGADFSTITNGPASNVDYSGISTSTDGTYYRRFQNNSGGSKSNFDLTISGGTATIVTSLGSVSGNNILVEVKLPGQTGWTVLIPFGTGPSHPTDGAGSLNGSLDSSVPATNSITFGGLSVAANDYIVVKVTAEQAWSGNISAMTVAWT